MFTKEQIEEIYNKLLLYSKKDSQFKEAVFPLSGDEKIAFLQNGANVISSMKELINDLDKNLNHDFVNISSDFTTKYSLEEAISLVPSYMRKQGLVITFIEEKIGDWAIYQYKGVTIEEWEDSSKWESIVKDEIVTSDQFSFSIREGNLMLDFIGEDPPIDTSIENTGELILKW